MNGNVLFLPLLLVLLSASLPGARGQSPDPASQGAEKWITDYAQKHNFNGTILVQANGKRICHQSFGLANLQFNISNSNNTRYKIASITKLFTSVLIMQLYEQGKLDLHQPIKTYLSGYSGDGGAKITIHNLLTATSGLEDFDKHGLDVYERPFTTDELLARFCSKSEMEPGKKYNYNNADYVILGKIIEAIYKKPYEQVLSEQLLQPLKMQNTGMCADATITKNLANTYYWDDSTKTATNSEHNYIENYYASGAMYSTASDLLLFANALYGNKLLKSDTLKLLLQPSLGTYACGLWVYDLNINSTKVKIAERQGNIRGATTRLLRVLDKDVTIILLTNMYRANLDEFQVEIMKHLIFSVR